MSETTSIHENKPLYEVLSEDQRQQLWHQILVKAMSKIVQFFIDNPEELEDQGASPFESRSEVGAGQNIASATNDDQITKDGLDNLAIVKQAEADQFKQDLG